MSLNLLIILIFLEKLSFHIKNTPALSFIIETQRELNIYCLQILNIYFKPTVRQHKHLTINKHPGIYDWSLEYTIYYKLLGIKSDYTCPAHHKVTSLLVYITY